LADLAYIPEAWRADHDPRWLYQDYAWDHTRGILYAAGLASPIYRLKIK
jgi:hypothetical protein